MHGMVYLVRLYIYKSLMSQTNSYWLGDIVIIQVEWHLVSTSSIHIALEPRLNIVRGSLHYLFVLRKRKHGCVAKLNSAKAFIIIRITIMSKSQKCPMDSMAYQLSCTSALLILHALNG